MKKLQYAFDQLKETEEDLVTERSKIADMNKNVEMCEILHRKVQEVNDKVRIIIIIAF